MSERGSADADPQPAEERENEEEDPADADHLFAGVESVDVQSRCFSFGMAPPCPGTPSQPIMARPSLQGSSEALDTRLLSEGESSCGAGVGKRHHPALDARARSADRGPARRPSVRRHRHRGGADIAVELVERTDFGPHFDRVAYTHESSTPCTSPRRSVAWRVRHDPLETLPSMPSRPHRSIPIRRCSRRSRVGTPCATRSRRV